MACVLLRCLPSPEIFFFLTGASSAGIQPMFQSCPKSKIQYGLRGCSVGNAKGQWLLDHTVSAVLTGCMVWRSSSHSCFVCCRMLDRQRDMRIAPALDLASWPPSMLPAYIRCTVFPERIYCIGVERVASRDLTALLQMSKRNALDGNVSLVRQALSVLHSMVWFGRKGGL